MSSTKFTCKHGSTEMLSDRNYHSWKRSLKAFLIAEDAFGIVTGTEEPPNAGANAQLRDFRRRSGRAYSLIYASSDETTRSLIDNLPDEEPNHVWTALRVAFDTSASLSGRLATVRRFHKTAMQPGTSVSAYISTLKDIRQPLAGSEERISDNVLIGHLLSTLPETFANIAGIIENKPAAELTLNAVTTSLVNAETSMTLRNAQVGSNTNTASTIIDGNALATTVRSGSINQGNRGQNSGRGGHRRWQPYSNQRQAESNPKCYYCLREGHRERDCSLKQNAADYRKERQGEWSATAASAQFTVEDDGANECDLRYTEVHGF